MRRINVRLWIANRMPRWLVYFCSIRMIAHATQGKWSTTNVPKLSAVDALGRWERISKEGE